MLKKFLTNAGYYPKLSLFPSSGSPRLYKLQLQPDRMDGLQNCRNGCEFRQLPKEEVFFVKTYSRLNLK